MPGKRNDIRRLWLSRVRRRAWRILSRLWSYSRLTQKNLWELFRYRYDRSVFQMRPLKLSRPDYRGDRPV